jgi:AcrR family transcriptional regulator
MGRRSTHTPDELRTLILDSAQTIIEENGLAGLSAREIARRIAYSPGTIYNMYENLDDVVLHVEARVLDKLDAALAAIPREATPEAAVRRLAHTYLEFTRDNRRLWNLLFEHYLPKDVNVPDWYQQKIEGLMARVESALAPLFPKDPDGQERQRAARVLWASVHGITSLATTDKLSNVTSEGATQLIDELVTRYLSGLAVERRAAA